MGSLKPFPVDSRHKARCQPITGHNCTHTLTPQHVYGLGRKLGETPKHREIMKIPHIQSRGRNKNPKPRYTRQSTIPYSKVYSVVKFTVYFCSLNDFQLHWTFNPQCHLSSSDRGIYPLYSKLTGTQTSTLPRISDINTPDFTTICTHS